MTAVLHMAPVWFDPAALHLSGSRQLPPTPDRFAAPCWHHEPMRKVLWLAGYVWALPVTMLGLMLSMLFARLESVDEEGLLHFVVQSGTPLAWYMRRFHVAAFTVGAVVTYSGADGPRQIRLVRHERAHVLQTLVLGPFFLPLYALASLWQLARGGHPYRDNWFEVRARAAEVPGDRALRLVR